MNRLGSLEISSGREKELGYEEKGKEGSHQGTEEGCQVEPL
jgi:hypothetical protein